MSFKQNISYVYSEALLKDKNGRPVFHFQTFKNIHLPIAQQSFYWHIFEVIWVFIPNPEPTIWIWELDSGCSVTTNRKPYSGQVGGEQVWEVRVSGLSPRPSAPTSTQG